MSSYSDLATSIINKNGQGGKFSGLNTALDLRQAFKDAGTQFAMQQQLTKEQGYNTGVSGIISSSNMYGVDPSQAIQQYREAVNAGVNGSLPTANPNGASSLATGTPDASNSASVPVPTSTPTNASSDNSGRDENYLSQISQYNPGRAATIKAMADYRGDPSKLGGRFGQALQDQVNRYDPNFDAADYKEKQSFINSNWNKGDLFKSRQAIENLVQHVNLLQSNFDKIDNGNLLIANAAGNSAKIQTGNAQVTNALLDSKAVGTEMAKTLRGGGILNEQEQKDIQTQLNAAASPDQMHGAIQQMMHLAEPRINSSLEMYKSVMGKYPTGAYSPEAISAIKNISPDVYNNLAPKLGVQGFINAASKINNENSQSSTQSNMVGKYTFK